METPRPLVTNPTISSPGTGLQHLEKCTATSVSPFTIIPLFFFPGRHPVTYRVSTVGVLLTGLEDFLLTNFTGSKLRNLLTRGAEKGTGVHHVKQRGGSAWQIVSIDSTAQSLPVSQLRFGSLSLAVCTPTPFTLTAEAVTYSGISAA